MNISEGQKHAPIEKKKTRTKVKEFQSNIIIQRRRKNYTYAFHQPCGMQENQISPINKPCKIQVAENPTPNEKRQKTFHIKLYLITPNQAKNRNPNQHGIKSNLIHVETKKNPCTQDTQDNI